MKKILWKKWFILLSICVGIAGGYHLIEQRIPSVMHLYEEDVKEVLSGTGKRIEPGKLSLDFPGDVQVSKSSDGYTAVCHLFGMIPVKTTDSGRDSGGNLCADRRDFCYWDGTD